MAAPLLSNQELPRDRALTAQELACSFCGLAEPVVLLRNQHALAFRDRFPVSPGHTLVVSNRHLHSVFDATPAELASLWELVQMVRSALMAEFAPDGFTIGVNDGGAAGQTIAHGHIHVIPRYSGDVPDPRGGIRWVIPAHAAYWQQP
jgi:diadenosine tetraphosphate (Ap4A) HIT family hydrolase